MWTNERMFNLFIQNINEGISRDWENSKGRKAAQVIFEGARFVCEKHKIDLLLENGKPGKLGIHADIDSVGGGAGGGAFNNRIALKDMSEHKLFQLSEAEREKVIRNPDNWLEDKKGKPVTWWFKPYTPDVAMYMRQRTSNPMHSGSVWRYSGMLICEVQSAAEHTDMVTKTYQAVSKAMLGLLIQPYAAALVISPEHANFADIALKDGFLNLKTQCYSTAIDGHVKPEKFQALFQDLVLYLWHKYYD